MHICPGLYQVCTYAGRILVMLDSLIYTGTFVYCQLAPTAIVSSLISYHCFQPISYLSGAPCVEISQIYQDTITLWNRLWFSEHEAAFWPIFSYVHQKLWVKSGENWVIYIRIPAGYSVTGFNISSYDEDWRCLSWVSCVRAKKICFQ